MDNHGVKRKGNFPPVDEAAVKLVVKEVQARFETAEYDRLQEYLRSKRDVVSREYAELAGSRRRPVHCLPNYLRSDKSKPLSSSSLREVKKANKSKHIPNFSVTISGNSKSAELSATVATIPVTAESRLPIHSLCIPIEKIFVTEDATDLVFVPLLGNTDEDMGDVLSEHDTSQREKLIELGAECQQEQTNAKIDQILTLLYENRPLSTEASLLASNIALVASSLGETVARIQSRYDLLHSAINEADLIAGDSTTKKMTKFDETLSSCRDMWCRLCYRYDCTIHGQREKQSVETQLELALKKQNDDFWRKFNNAQQHHASNDSMFAHVKTLSDAQKSMCFVVYSIFDGNVQQMSHVLRAPASVIQDYINTHGITGIVPTAFAPKTKEKKYKPAVPYYSVRHYSKPWYDNYRDAPIFRHFFPCHHDEPCSDDNCSCVQNNFLCTLACGWGRESRNFFRGCSCKAGCRLLSCTCVALRRECDPDLCICSGCSDCDGFPTLTPECNNSNILMGRNPVLLIGKSSVSGWGLYTKQRLQKGDYVGEYVGEAISQGEADRRGKLADAMKCSYIFMLASDLNIDSSQKGNKTRFMNHSSTPNVEPKILFVKGEQRIGFVARHAIEAQAELFFDYRYKTEMDNDRVVLKTPAGGVGWTEISQER